MTTPPTDLGDALTREDVAAIAADVWACYLGDRDALRATASSDGPCCDGYVATVGITGAWTGRVVLELAPGTAERIARIMLATDRVSTADVSDALGELVNIIGGNLKGLVPQPSVLGLPLVLEADAAPVGRDVASTSATDLDWLGEPLRISVRESARTGTEG